MTATLASAPASVLPGGTINYTAKVTNVDVVNKTGVNFSLPLDANTALVAGTLNASPYTIDQPAVTATSGVGKAITLQAVDPDAGDTLTYAITQQPANGTLTGTAPNLTYTPNGTFSGTETIKFKATDSKNVQSNEDGVITITVTQQAPAAAADPGYQTARSAPLTIPTPGVLGSDTLNFAPIVSYGAGTGNEQTTIGTSTPTKTSFSGNDTFKYGLTIVSYTCGNATPLPESPLTFGAGGIEAADVASINTIALTQAQLVGLVSAARAQWEATRLTDAQRAVLQEVRVDAMAGGHGWYVGEDSNDVQFMQRKSGTRFYTTPERDAAGRIDLLRGQESGVRSQRGEKDARREAQSNYTAADSPYRNDVQLLQRGFPIGSAALWVLALAAIGSGFWMRRRSVALIALVLLQGALLQGSAQAATITENIGNLPPGKSTTITFSTTVSNTPAPPLVPQVVQQATVSGSNFATVVSDNPATAGALGDPTVTTITYSPDVAIVLGHGGANFSQGQMGANLTVDVFNNGGTTFDPTAREVRITVPLGFARPLFVASVAGWTIDDPTAPGYPLPQNSYIARRSDTLAPGQHYPLLMLPVNVGFTTPPSLTVTATVQDLGADSNAGNNSSSDPVPVNLVMLGVTPPTPFKTYVAGESLDFKVNYSHIVTVAGLPTLTLDIGGVQKQAVYIGGGPGIILQFRYIVAAGDIDSNGIATVSPLVLNGGAITDQFGKAAGITFTPQVLGGITIDAITPTITSVTPPANKTYIQDDNIDFTVNFSEPVTFASTGGAPRMPVTVGATARNATYLSGSGTSSAIFRISVASGDLDTDGIAAVSPLALNGGTIKDAAGNNAVLTFTPPATPNVLVDGVAPAITGVTPPTNGSYRGGQTIDFTVNFSDSVIVNTASGTPSMSLTVGVTARSAAYVSGSGSTALVFRYTVQSLDADTDGIASISPLALNGGSIRDASGNNSTLTFTPPNTTGVLVDTTVPTIASVAIPPDGSYRAGQNLDFTVNFTEPVNVAGGTPTLSMTVGSAARSIAYISGSGTNALLFRHTVQAGDNDNNGVAVPSPLLLNGATIRDAAGNNATLTFAPLDTVDVIVDTTAPTIVSINRNTPLGPLTNAASVTYTVTFSENVTGVDGADFAVVTTGTVAISSATTVNGSGANYTVSVNGISGAGTLRLDALDTGTVLDPAGNALSLALFSSPSASGVGSQPRSIASGDFNGDGKPDLAVANNGTNTVSVLLGIGDGTFQPQATYPAGTEPRSVAVGDFNGDGKQDLAIANFGGNVSILLGNGDGTFQPQVGYSTGGSATSIAIADFNGDNKADLVVANFSPSNVAVLLGNGNGTFGPATTIAVGSNPASVSVGDLNGDSKADIVTANLGSNDVSILLNNGSGGFTSQTPLIGGAGTTAVTLSDLNADGKADIVATYATGLYVFSGNGNGTFQAGVNYILSPFRPFRVAAGDVNGDGKVDLVVGAAADSAISVLLGTGAGAFALPQSYATGTPPGLLPIGVVLADFNGDGKPDVAAVNFGGVSVSTLLNKSSSIGQTYTIDRIGPQVLSLVRADTNPTSADSVQYTLTFNEAVTNITASDFTITKTGSANAVVGPITGTGATRTVRLDNVVGDGTLRLDVNTNAALTDLAGNTLAVNEVQTVMVTGTTGTFTLTFNGQTTGSLPFNASASQVQNALTALSSIGGVGGAVSVSAGQVYTVQFGGNLAGTDLSLLSGSGSGGAVVAVAQTTAGGPATTPFIGEVYDVDNSGPVITLGAPSQFYVNNAIRVSFTVTVTDPHLGTPVIGNAAFANNLVTTGTTTSDFPIVFMTGNATQQVYVVSLKLDGDGTATIALPAGLISDAVGNPSLAVGSSQAVTVDNTAPAIAISAPSVSNTLNGPVSWTVTYADANFNSSTLAPGDITLNASPGVNVGSIQVTGTGNTRTVTLDTITGFGTLGFSINAGTATDLAGNIAAAGGPSPTVQINSPPTIAGTVANQAVNDNATIAPFANVTIADVDLPAQTLAISFTLDDPAKGSITTLNGFTDVGGGVFTFSGDAAAATGALQGVVFTPAPNRLPVGGTETLSIALTATDTFSPVTTDNTTSIVITSINDAPANVQITATAAAITENVPLTVNGTFADPDTQDAHSVSIDWGDGRAPTVVPLAAGVFAFSTSHTYLNNPPQDSFTITATVTDASNASASAQIGVSTLPAFLSGPTATPNPAVVDLTVAFSVTPTPTDALVTWNFGDGTASATGANVSHIYTAAGTYAVTVSAQNPRTGTATSATLSLDVIDGTSVPNTLPIQLTRGFIRFGANADRVVLQSVIQLVPGQAVAGQTITFSINALTRTFVLNSRGKAVTPEAHVHLRVFKFTVNGAQAKLTLSLKGQLKAGLASGVALDATGNPKKAAISVGVGTKSYSDVKPLIFKRNSARFGFGR